MEYSHHDAMRDILEFVEPQKGYSYYDLKRYSYENNKEEWIALLKDKNTRRVLSLYFRSKRAQEKIPYKTYYGYTDEELRALEEIRVNPQYKERRRKLIEEHPECEDDPVARAALKSKFLKEIVQELNE